MTSADKPLLQSEIRKIREHPDTSLLIMRKQADKIEDLTKRLKHVSIALEVAVLSSHQYRILKHIRKVGEVSSAYISEVYDTSVQSASVKLRILWDKGYLWRRGIRQESGGNEYLYKAKDVDYE